MAPGNDTRTELIEEVGLEFTELRQAADRLDEAVAALYGLNRTDLRCLGILYRRGRVTAGELAEESGLTPGAITTALDRLEKSGYANRVADPEDRRRVLVLSTVAAREVGARLYGEVEVAGHRLLEPRSADELTAIRDYLRGTRQVYESQTGQIAVTLSGGEAVSAEGGAGENLEFSAPLAKVDRASFYFVKGISRLSLRGDPTLKDLYRGRFDGQAPEVSVRGNTVAMQYKRRFSPFTWGAQSSDVTLNANIPWSITLKGGLSSLSADLRTLRIESLEISGGASEVEVWLPAAQGKVPVRLSGGASNVTLHRPAGVAMRADMNGGASQLIFDGQRASALGSRTHFETPGINEAADRYEVSFSGGASQITIDVV